MLTTIRQRWHAPAGYREVITLALPLIATTSTTGVQTFIDRLLISWHSSDALAATVPASFVCITLTALLMGVASYVSVFVAQFSGARKPDMCSKIVWQGLYIALAALPLAWLLSLGMSPLFAWIGHAPQIQVMEVAFSEILTLAIPLMIAFTTVAGFFTGLGKAALVMWVNLLITVINLSLDHLLIFGHWGFPSLGVAGAAWATFLAYGIGTLILLFFFLQAHLQPSYQTRRTWQWNRALLAQIWRFGFPVGLQIQLERLAWTVFILVIGSLGVAELTAHSIAMNVFMIVVMPMAGISAAVAVLVARRMGEGDSALAVRVTSSAMHLGSILFLFVAAVLIYFPDPMVDLFAKSMSASLRAELLPLIQTLLKMMAAYAFLQMMAMMFAGALRGAGDTSFVARSGIVVTWGSLVLPVVLLTYFGTSSLILSWWCLVLSGLCLCVVYGLRYRQAKWRHLTVVDDTLAATASSVCETDG